MDRAKSVWLGSVIALFFMSSIPLVQSVTFAAEPAGKADTVSFEVLNPEAEMIMASDISMITPRIADLSDKNIGLVWAGKSGGEFFLDALEVLLKKKYPSYVCLIHAGYWFRSLCQTFQLYFCIESRYGT